MAGNINTSQNAPKNNASSHPNTGQAEIKDTAAKTAEVVQAHVAAAQESVRSGVDMATEASQQTSARIHEMFASDKAKEAMKQSSRHVEALSAASSVLSQGFQDVSREWMNFAKRGAEKSNQAFADFAKCRSPQEFMEVQSRLIKENLELLATSTQKIAEISTDFTKQASQKVAA